MRRPLSVLMFLFVLTGVSVSACGTSGRDLREPVEGAVSPTRATSTTIATTTIDVAGSTLAPLSLASTAFDGGAPIPPDYSCKGPSPALQWSGVPAGTKELVLVVVDETADGFVHWLVTGIPATSVGTARGQAPPGAVQHANSASGIGWYGPCPTGSATHSYIFTLMALTTPSGISNSTSAKDAVKALNDLVRSTGGAQVTLAGTFGAQSSGTSPGSGVAPTLGTSPRQKAAG